MSGYDREFWNKMQNYANTLKTDILKWKPLRELEE